MPPVVLLDQDPNAFETTWAAAGTPNSVFPLTRAELQCLTGASFSELAKRG